jgi:hypothetical protein
MTQYDSKKELSILTKLKFKPVPPVTSKANYQTQEKYLETTSLRRSHLSFSTSFSYPLPLSLFVPPLLSRSPRRTKQVKIETTTAEKEGAAAEEGRRGDVPLGRCALSRRRSLLPSGGGWRCCAVHRSLLRRLLEQNEVKRPRSLDSMSSCRFISVG